MKSVVTRVAALVLVVAPFALINSPATADVTDSFTPTGVSWVSVPMADRHYMNELGATAPGGYDDWGVGLVPAGASCTNNGVTAPAGDMVPIGAGTCTDASSNPVDPTAITKIPFGFNVNFFGTTYNGGWLNTNGGLTFDAPTSAYNQTLFSDRRFSTHNWCLPVS